MSKKGIFIFLLFLTNFLILSHICLAEITPEELKNNLVLPERDTEMIFMTLPEELTEKWIDVTASPYSDPQEQAVLVMTRGGFNVKSLNYVLIELPKKIGTDLIKAIYKIAVFIYSPDKISQLLDEFEKKSVEEAKKYALEWLLQKEIRVAAGNLKLSYRSYQGDWQNVIFPYIVVYRPLNPEKGEIGIEVYSSRPIDSPLPTWQHPWVGGINEISPFILHIKGKIEETNVSSYRWAERPTIEIEFPDYVPEFEFKEPSWLDKIGQKLEEQTRALEKVGEELNKLGQTLKEKGKQAVDKGKEKIKNLWEWLKSTANELNPFGAQVVSFPVEEFEVFTQEAPAIGQGETLIQEPSEQEKESSEENKKLPEITEVSPVEEPEPELEPEPEEPESKSYQDQIDDIYEELDIIGQKIAEIEKIIDERLPSQKTGEGVSEEIEPIKEETEEEMEEEEEVLPESVVLCQKQGLGFPKSTAIIINEVAWMGTKNSANDEWVELKNIADEPINLAGWQLLDRENDIKVVFGQNSIIPTNSFYLLERTDDSTVPWEVADLIYTGGLNNSEEALYLFNQNCELEDGVVAFPDWPAGNVKEKKSMEKGLGGSWHTFERGCLQGVCGTPKAENSQPIAQGPSGQGPQGGGIQLPPSYCSQENLGAPIHLPVVINEIAWMGTESSSNNEWIELKNISQETVVLGSWQLLDKDLQIKIVFTFSDLVGPGEFLLLERTDDDTVPGVPADKIYVGALGNENESLRLFDASCNLIDEVVDSPDWLAGDNTEKRTMERLDDLSWHTFIGEGENGILGTPKAENSQLPGPPGPPAPPEPASQFAVINEIAWMGTVADFNDEWLELYNNTDTIINLSGWTLKALDGTPEIELTGLIFAKYFYLLERTDDTTVSDIVADQIYTGALGNEGEILELRDNQGSLVDRVDCSSGQWFAGNNEQKLSMERMDSQVNGSDSQNWNDNDLLHRNGLDSNNGFIWGTPKANNSVSQILPQTRYVPDGYPTIQAAVDAANNGDTIIVRDGTYTEGIVVDKTLIIQSENGPGQTIVQGASDAFSITANNVEINGFTISGGVNNGIRIDSFNNVIKNNNIHSNIYGIWVDENMQNNRIENNIIHDNQEWGIFLNHSTANTILNNEMVSNGLEGGGGVYAGGSSNTISQNNISNNKNGIFLWGDGSNTVSNNNINNNVFDGINLSYTSQNTITENQAKLNGSYGINFWCAGGNNIFRNNFENEHNFTYGLWIGCGQPPPNVWNSPEQITYTYNGNMFTSYLGNHWSDYNPILEEGQVIDADTNGVGDWPYYIFGSPDKDDYPLILPFENY